MMFYMCASKMDAGMAVGMGVVRVSFAWVCVLMCNIILTYLCLFNIHRMLNVRISHLSEDLHARDEQVKSLLQQLK